MQLIETLQKLRRIPWWAKAAVIVAILGAVLFAPLRTGEPFTGKVVDSRTGLPIPGTVVVGYWTYVIPNPIQSLSRCLDACETITNASGEFAIPRLRGLFYDWIGRFNIVFYKLDYCNEYLYIDDDWEGTMRNRGFWRDGRAIIELEPATPEQLGFEGRPPSGGCGRRDKKPLAELISESERWEKKIYDQIRQKVVQ